MEEYTGPRTCELCEYGRNLPCKYKGCNSANGLKDFKPKGIPTEGSPKWKIDYLTYNKKDDHITVSLSNESGGGMIVAITPNEIAGLAK